MNHTRLAVLLIAALLVSGQLYAHDRKFVTPFPKGIAALFSIKHLSDRGEPHQTLFEGLKDSVGIESGRVTMTSGKKGERHNTEIYEEVLLILEGKGSVEIDGERHALTKGDVVYIPPHQIHQMMSDRGAELEYLYVAAPTFIPPHMELQPSKLKKKGAGK